MLKAVQKTVYVTERKKEARFNIVIMPNLNSLTQNEVQALDFVIKLPITVLEVRFSLAAFISQEVYVNC